MLNISFPVKSSYNGFNFCYCTTENKSKFPVNNTDSFNISFKKSILDESTVKNFINRRKVQELYDKSDNLKILDQLENPLILFPHPNEPKTLKEKLTADPSNKELNNIASKIVLAQDNEELILSLGEYFLTTIKYKKPLNSFMVMHALHDSGIGDQNPNISRLISLIPKILDEEARFEAITYDFDYEKYFKETENLTKKLYKNTDPENHAKVAALVAFNKGMNLMLAKYAVERLLKESETNEGMVINLPKNKKFKAFLEAFPSEAEKRFKKEKAELAKFIREKGI